MKVLKYIGIGVAALILLFLAIGMFSPSVNYGSETTVNAPIETAWAVFTDDSKMGEWIPGFKSIKLIEGEENTVGSVYEMVVESEGETMVMTETMTAYEEQEHFGFLLDNDVMTVQADIRFSAAGDGTKIVSKNETKGKNILFRSLFAMMKGSFAEQEQINYILLKDQIEKAEADNQAAAAAAAAESASADSTQMEGSD